MNLIDILTTGGIGSAIGAIAGIGERVILGKMEAQKKTAEWEHIRVMQQLQYQHETREAEYGLRNKVEEVTGQVWAQSFEHDSAMGETSVWVNNIRALVRPVALVICFPLTYFEPLTFAGYLGMMLSWYFASRGRTTSPL